MRADHNGQIYDRIGRDYSSFRREDPDWAGLIEEALGSSRTVVNVGAGAGAYEPRTREVVAVEPSEVMRAQRPIGAASTIAAYAQDLPLDDGSFDAAMSVLSLHHWHPEQEQGVREMVRVARRRVVLMTIDPAVSSRTWIADYLPEVAELDLRIFPRPRQIAAWLAGDTTTSVVPISRDTPDWALISYWAHPERLLDPMARMATSGLARLPSAVVDRGVAELEADLANGGWEQRYGRLRSLQGFDAGLRLIVAEI